MSSVLDKPANNRASKYRGVYKCGKKWKTQIQIDGVQHYIGVFDTQERAATEYQAASIRLGRLSNSIPTTSSRTFGTDAAVAAAAADISDNTTYVPLNHTSSHKTSTKSSNFTHEDYNFNNDINLRTLSRDNHVQFLVDDDGVNTTTDTSLQDAVLDNTTQKLSVTLSSQAAVTLTLKLQLGKVTLELYCEQIRIHQAMKRIDQYTNIIHGSHNYSGDLTNQSINHIGNNNSQTSNVQTNTIVEPRGSQSSSSSGSHTDAQVTYPPPPITGMSDQEFIASRLIVLRHLQEEQTHLAHQLNMMSDNHKLIHWNQNITSTTANTTTDSPDHHQQYHHHHQQQQQQQQQGLITMLPNFEQSVRHRLHNDSTGISYSSSSSGSSNSSTNTEIRGEGGGHFSNSSNATVADDQQSFLLFQSSEFFHTAGSSGNSSSSNSSTTSGSSSR